MKTLFSLKSTVRFASYLLFFIFLIPNISCKKKKTNKELFNETKSSGLAYYKNKDTIYSPKGGSPHGEFKLRFNSAALSKLDAQGRLPIDGSFDKGALIVKEIYKNGTLDMYAVMKKDPTSKFASSGWIWAEYGTDGSSIYDITKRGEGCTGCHSVASNRDLVRSFDLH
jgi:hypothetical protein